MEFCFLLMFSAVLLQIWNSNELSLTRIGILLESKMEAEGVVGDYQGRVLVVGDGLWPE